jgi:hypothetical protein
MVANTLLEIYTLIFAWNMYGAIWDILTGSGLALIPFVAALLNNFIENYKDGDAESTVKDLELRIVGMILVLMLCVIPYKGFSVSLATVKYDLATPDCNPPANVTGTGNNTGTAYDSSFAGSSGMDVYKPVAWSFVEFLSSAITHSTIKSMSCANNYQFMLLRISQITIQSEELKGRVKDFASVCYNKAIDRFKINPVILPPTISAVEDIDWLGSRVLLNAADEYYRHPESYMTNMEKFDFTRQVIFRKSDEANVSGANPYCNEVWSGETGFGGVPSPSKGLRELLLADIPDDAAGDVLEAWKAWGSEVMTIGVVDEATKEDLILKLILQANAANLSSKSTVNLSNNFDINDSTTDAVLDMAFAGFGFFANVNEALEAQAMQQIMQIAGPMVLALIQMIIIMGAPFVLVLGRYQLSTFITIALAYFAFEFINAIWAAAYWFDNRILDLYTSQAGFVDSVMNGAIIATISSMSTILLPAIWLSVIAYSGAGMVRSMGMGGVGGGAAYGAGALRSSRRLVKGVSRLGKKKK